MSEKDDLGKLLSSATLVFFGMVLSSGSKLVERVLVARTIPPSEFGTIALLLAILTITSTLSLTGFQQGVPRFISRQNADSNRNGIIATAVTYTLVAATVTATATYFVVVNYDHQIFGHSVDKQLVALFCISIIFYAMLRLGVGIIRGFENTVYRTISYDIIFPFSRIALLALLIFLGGELYSLPLAYVVSLLTSVIVCYYLVSNLTEGFGPVGMYFKELTTFSAPLVLATISSLLITRTDTILLGILSGTENVAYYEAAYPIANSLVVLLSAVGFLYLPIASRQDHNQDYEKLRNIYRVTTKWVVMAIFPIFVTFILYPRFILGTVFGPQYKSGYIALVLLSIGFYTNASFGRSRETLSALGETKIVMYVNLFGFLFNLGLNVVLIPAYGIVGASVASVISFVLINILSVWWMNRRYKIHPFGVKNVKMISGLCGLAIALSFLHNLYPGEIVGVTISGTLSVIGIISIFLMLRCYQEEDEILYDYLGRLPFIG